MGDPGLLPVLRDCEPRPARHQEDGHGVQHADRDTVLGVPDDAFPEGPNPVRDARGRVHALPHALVL